MRHAVLASAVALALLSTAALAGEGMWVPQQLPEIAGPLKKAGLKLSAKQMSDLTGDPLGAIVSLGGCTAGFVSKQGLVATNHHCVYGAIQLNSTAEKNLIQTGFSAATPKDELSAGPNARIYVLDSIRDVTAQAKAAIAGASTPLGRTQALEALEKKLIAECEAEAGYRCRLYSFSGGNVYRLFRNLEIRDVRLAYAPPSSIGNYGGEVDNWMWPRHTGDFSFYRAYVGPDGKPAAYSPNNVPYTPKRFLKLADKPLGQGDFVMVAGYPGSTSRYALASEFDNTASWTYPVVGGHYKRLVAMVEAAGRKNPDIAVKYADTVKSWQNVMKNYDGQLEGFTRIDAAAQKQREEKAVLDWLRKQGAKGQAGLASHQRLEQLVAEARATRERDVIVAQLRRTGVLGAATQVYRYAIEQAKPDAQREPGYQQRDLPALEGALRQMERRYQPTMDRQLVAYWLREYVKLPQAQRIAELDRWLDGDNERAIDRALDRLEKTKLGDTTTRLALLKSSRADLEKSRDPALQFAVAVMPAMLKLEEEAKTRAGEMLVHRPVFLKAVADYRKSRGQFVYPDANSSLRITFGNVMGYTKADGSVQPSFTTLEQVAQKATGQEPFDAPQVQLDAIRAKNYGGLADKRLGTVPVNFLSDLDITGGNSGSPVLDAQGRLVGLAFDGNWESVSSNWVYDPKMTRMIAVDQRYMRWVMQEVFPAPQLLAEMGVPEKR
ncbi:S46 family peptidase [Lysobacter humi (ex Lee et al. 2017)]